MRGKWHSPGATNSWERNIPAYAGKISVGRSPYITGAKHPRVCGENYLLWFLDIGLSGTSPRMRGKFRCRRRLPSGNRNIPAYAGKMLLARSFGRRLKEHPRVCGENFWARPMPFQASGTSPRMRGKCSVASSMRSCKRNIPAYAGKIVGSEEERGWCWEHPRVCGENRKASGAVIAGCGTSPRMRGKCFKQCFRIIEKRNIPAYAGKIKCRSCRRTRRREHPRVCGENHPPG